WELGVRKRSGQRRNPISIHVPILNLDDDDEPPPIPEVNAKKKKDEGKVVVNDEEEVEEKKVDKDGVTEESSCSNAAVLPCLDKLREELSCAICLEICFEPSTTSCGHSFCKKCLRSAADKCGKKCPKCRQLISNGRSCTVNTVLWNTIQLLFPKEVEARKVAEGKERVKNEIRKSSRGVNPSEQRILTRVQNQDTSAVSWRLRRQESSNADEVQNQDTSAVSWRLRRQESSNADEDSSALAGRSRRTSRAGGGQMIRSQDGDSALALRLQRQEFNGETDSGSAGRRALSRARANLRAMASRAVSVRSRAQLYL
ncbi:E3 ubiquitin-protein ligase RNF168, partial [Linum grandiflorum]